MTATAVIGDSRNETNVDLVTAWRAAGIAVELLSAAEAERRLGPGDVALCRIDVLPTLDGVEPGLLDLLRLARRGVRVLNSARATVNAHDKLRTARLLEAAGLWAVPTEHVLPGRLPRLVPPLVLKPRFGSWGRDVFRCDTTEAVWQAVAVCASRDWYHRHGVLAQPLLPPIGRDLRVLVAAGHVVGCESRVSRRGEWRTNISLGGSHLNAVPGPVEEALAIAAVEALGGDFFGVDLLPTLEGYMVLEVNAAVEFDPGYSLLDGDVFEDLAEALHVFPAAAPAAA